MKKIIHLSDFHIGCVEDDGANSLKEHFDEIISYLTNKIENPEDHIVIITGDIVHNANRDDFNHAAEKFEELRAKGYKVYVVPGNHDYRVKEEKSGDIENEAQARDLFMETFYGGDGSFPKKDIIHFNGPEGLEQKIALIGLDSDAEQLKGSYGELGDTQRDALAEWLEKPEIQECDFRVVYLHHNPFAHRLSLWGMKLLDGRKFKKVLKKKNVSLLLYGHTHSMAFKIDKKKIGLSIDGGTTTGRRGKNQPSRIIDIAAIDFKKIEDYEKEEVTEMYFDFIREDWRK